MNKDTIKNRLDRAFKYLDLVVPQPGASVDMLASGRNELRVLWAELNRPERKEKEVEQDG